MTEPTFNRKDQAAVSTMRLLAADMVEKAKSGHPGLPLGAAPMAYVLLSRFLKHNPADPKWPGRDRFILSPGHGSAMLYAWLHLAGYGVSLEELKNFRQWGSLTPGHPEYGHTPGVEATTGPLGHGFAMGVGMAMAQRVMAARFDRPGFELFDHNVYAIVSDGDLMEGVSSEAASLAGTLALGRLVYLYDNNHITIEGRTDIAFAEDVRARFLAYGWQVHEVRDGENLGAVYLAIQSALASREAPSLIMVGNKIGAGSPKEDTPKAHGEPLGPEAIRATRKFYGYPEDQEFTVDGRVYELFKALGEPHLAEYQQWQRKFAEYEKAYPAEAAELKRRWAGELPGGYDGDMPSFERGGAVATRASSGKILNALAAKVPELIGGSADLAPSNKSDIAGGGSFSAVTPGGRNIHFGIREHAMGAAVNGMALYGGLVPYGATFMVFSDFVRPALRLAALMKLREVYIFTHDSIGVGEDGPTHQPVEQLAALRAIPGLTLIRPADAYEAMAAWRVALKRQGPTALALSRQNLPTLHPDDFPAVLTGPEKGAYVLSEAAGGAPEAIIMATGSEVALALEAQKTLAAQGRRVRVVSMPSWELFEEQSQEYKDEVLPPSVTKRLSVEAGIAMGWERYTGTAGKNLSVEGFGTSAPAGRVFQSRGFTAENVAALAGSL